MGKLIIDGLKVDADPNKTVLDVARDLGIEIPTLCHHKSLHPFGSCRICVVEKIWKGESTLQTACTYPAWEGEIRTNSEMVLRARKFILKLMLASAPESEEICKLAEKYQVFETPYKHNPKKWNNKCIMCGLCVRVCDEIMNISAIGFAKRGSERYIATPLDEYSETCSTCGACEFVCPTNAINVSDWTDREIKPHPSIFERGLISRPAVSVHFPQAVPNIPFIDKDVCMHFLNDSCGICEDVCVPEAIDFKQKDKIEEFDVGALVIATGFDLYPLMEIPEYGGGKIPDVIDALQFERLLAASGPTAGVVKRPSDGKIPESVAFIHCVRSRDPEHGVAYCSKICCTYLVKEAMLYKQAMPNGSAYSFYIDIRTGGKGYEEFYQRTKEDWVTFIRGKPARIVQNGDKVQVWSADTLSGESIKLDVDLVVLAPAIIPSAGSVKILKDLRLATDEYGWIKEQHLKLRPLESMIAGIFMAGMVQYPKDITDSVAQASGAAAKVLELFSQPELKRTPTIASVDTEICVGCGYCEETCPYEAIKVDERKKVAEVNAALCEGCGACAASCPSGAAQHKNFFKDQIFAMVVEATKDY